MQRHWGMARWGRRVDETGRLLGPPRNGQAFPTLVCSSPCPGKGNCPRTKKGGIWVVFPTQVQEEVLTCLMESSVARPGGWVGNAHAFVFSCLCFVSGRQRFLGKVPCRSSKFGLADPRERQTCLHLGKEISVSSRQNQRVQGRRQGHSGQDPWPLLTGPFL